MYNPPNTIFGGPPTIYVLNAIFCSPVEACQDPFGQYFNITGMGMPNPVFPEDAGKFLMEIPPSFTFNYWVIDVAEYSDDATGPYKFAAVIDPYFSGVPLTYVLSRETNVDPIDEETVVALLGKTESAGIPLDTIVPIVQEYACIYDP